eukprot:1136144-Pelagomonas_calceolata.AAC.10
MARERKGRESNTQNLTAGSADLTLLARIRRKHLVCMLLSAALLRAALLKAQRMGGKLELEWKGCAAPGAIRPLLP